MADLHVGSTGIYNNICYMGSANVPIISNFIAHREVALVAKMDGRERMSQTKWVRQEALRLEGMSSCGGRVRRCGAAMVRLDLH